VIKIHIRLIISNLNCLDVKNKSGGKLRNNSLILFGSSIKEKEEIFMIIIKIIIIKEHAW